MIVREGVALSEDDLEDSITSVLAIRWEPLTTGSSSAPELVFVNGDVILVPVPI